MPTIDEKKLLKNVFLTIPNLLNKSLVVHYKKESKRVPLAPLVMLVLESANRYITDKQSFGKIGKKTIDSVLKPAFEKIFSTDQYAQTLKEGLIGYRKLASAYPTPVHGKSMRTYLAKDAATIPLGDVLDGCLRTETSYAEWLQVQAAIAAANRPNEVNKKIIGSISGVECIDPEEQQTYKYRDVTMFGKEIRIQNPLFKIWGSGDEIYRTTFGTVFSDQEILQRQADVTSVTEHVGTQTGHTKKLPYFGGINAHPIEYNLQKSLPHSEPLPPYYAYYSTSLYEHEHSTEKRRMALVKAGMDATSAISSLVSLNFLGAAISIGTLLYDLGIALDDDDYLGSIAHFYCDLTNMADCDLRYDECITGSHFSNDYSYRVWSYFLVEEIT